MRVLVTGSCGFVGSHVQRILRQRGHTVTAVGSPRERECEGVDLTDESAVEQLVSRSQPDVIVHLAARFGPIDEWKALFGNNTRATYSVLFAAEKRARDARVLIASSSAVYGHVPPERNPVSEEEELRPVTVYGASKAAAEALVWPFIARGLHVVVCRAFNTVGPGSDPRSALAQWAQQIAAIRRSVATPVLRCGPLDTARDLTDVRDVARAYALLAEASSKVPSVVNICTGQAITGADLMKIMLEEADLTARVISTPAGADDIRYQCGSNRRIRNAVAWTPEISLRQTVRDVLADVLRRERPKAEIA